MIVGLTSLLAAVAIQAQSPAAAAADTFVEACLAAKGERAVVLELARARQWEVARPAVLPEGVAWMDAYGLPAGYVAVFETSRQESEPAISSSGIPLPTIIRLGQDQCVVALPGSGGDWQAAATILDGSEVLIASPQALPPSAPAGPEGIVRRYALSEMNPEGAAAGLVTVTAGADGALVIQSTRPRRND